MGKMKNWKTIRKNGISRWMKDRRENRKKKRKNKFHVLGRRKKGNKKGQESAITETENTPKARKKKKKISEKRQHYREKGQHYRKKRRHYRENRKSLWKKLKKALHDRFSQIKWRFGLYVPLCIFLAFLGSLLIGYVVNYLQDWCIAQYGADQEEIDIYYEYWYDAAGVLNYDYTGISGDRKSVDAIYSIVTILQVFLIPAWILFSVYLTGRIFYNKELKIPINLLLNASRRIADNQLDFRLEYDKPNEFGMLCRAFDEMRSALYDSNRQLWRSLEERKRLNAAFSHDLRTPLTVLRGYADFLEKYIPGGNVSEEKLLEVLGMMSSQIVRLEHYTQTMNSVQKLGDIVPNLNLTTAEQIKNSFLRTGELLCEGKRFELEWQGEGLLRFDVELVFQIYENLVANACRYAAECVSVKCAIEGGMFLFVVMDDGKGFGPEALRSAAEPFFRDEQEPDKTHFGLGLYICRILCDKCGGMLKIGNVTDDEGVVHGGKVTAMVACGK